MVEAMGSKDYGIQVTIDGMTSLLNFMKFCQLVQKLLVGDT
jgi:ligand-binding sensor protein